MLVPALTIVSSEFLTEKFVLNFTVHLTKCSMAFVMKDSDMNK